VRRADNLTTFMCRLSWNLGTSDSWNPQGLSRPVMGLIYLYLLASLVTQLFERFFARRKLALARWLTTVTLFHSSGRRLRSAFFCSCCKWRAVSSHASLHASFIDPCITVQNISVKQQIRFSILLCM